MKNKVLIITRNFPPHVGGMERFVLHVYRQLKKEYSCDVVGPAGTDAYLEAPDDDHSHYKSAPLPLFLLQALVKSLRLVVKGKYAVCIAGSGITAPLAVVIGKLFSIPVITFVHGLDLVVQNRIYQMLFVPFIKYSDGVVANSKNTARLAETKGVPSTRITIIYPGVESTIPDIGGRSFREEYKLQGNKILLSVGRLIPRKGLPEFVRCALPLVVEKLPETVLVIIGAEAKGALKRDKGVQDRIIEAARENNILEKVILAGRVEDTTVWSSYQESDLFVFPLKEEQGDVEGFGLVALEAASFGLPTAAFAIGGVVDAIEEGRSGFLVPGGDYPKMAEVIVEYLEKGSQQVTKEQCRSYAAECSWDRFGSGLRKICREVVL